LLILALIKSTLNDFRKPQFYWLDIISNAIREDFFGDGEIIAPLLLASKRSHQGKKPNLLVKDES
jgi:hypothetical protein